MSITFGMHVMQSRHHLMEVCSWNLFWELSGIGDVIEKLSSAHVLKHYGKTAVGCLIREFLNGIFSHVDQADEIRVIELLHDAKFMLQSRKICSCFLITFYRNEIPIFIFSKFDSKYKKLMYSAW